MRRTVKKLATGVEAPLVIDSTEANVIKEALEQYPGRAIVNSINMENGRLRIEAVLPLVRDRGELRWSRSPSTSPAWRVRPNGSWRSTIVVFTRSPSRNMGCVPRI